MDVQTIVQSWIQWSEKHLPLTGDIPKINIEDPVPAWIENSGDALTIAIDHRDHLLTCFMNYLADDPRNIPARFTALAIYYALSGRDSRYFEELLESVAGHLGLDSVELEMGRAEYSEDFKQLADDCERQAHKLIEGFNEDLLLVIHQLKTEDVRADWRVIRWEILNSYAVADWNRALKLYNIAEEANLLDIGDLQFMRGQFRYLRVFGAAMEVGLESLWWEPKILGLDVEESNSTLVVLMSGLRLSEFKTELTESSIDTLRDASNDLEKALNKRPKLSLLYGPMLARCYFSTGRLHDAATIYEQALNEWAVDVIRRWIYESLGIIYEGLHLPQKKIDMLARWAAEFPDEKGIHMQIAEMHARLLNLEALPISLRKEAERDPDVDHDWKISALIALGETRDVSERLLTELKSDTARFKATISLVEEYWPRFLTLSSKARDEWTAGLLLWHSSAPPPLHAMWLRKAAYSYATAVELELNSTVYSRFRNAAQSTDSIAETARSTDKKDDELKTFRAYILKQYPFDERSLTLGEMAFIIKQCKDSRKALFQEFERWVDENYPRLIKASEKLGKVNEFRRGPAHGNVPAISTEEIPSLCRDIIEIIK